MTYLCIIDIIDALLEKESEVITKVFQVKPSNQKNIGKERSELDKKFLLQDNNIEIYSRHNERKFVIAARLIKTLKEKV